MKKYKWINLYKGFCIILVIIGHLEIPNLLYKIIFSFHLYAFYFIGGVTYKNKDYKVFIINSIKRLIIPYLFFAFLWDIMHLVMMLYINRYIDLSIPMIFRNILTILLCKNYFNSNASIGPAWFLFSLFFVRLIFISIDKYAKQFKLFVIFCLFALGYIFNGNNFLPFSIIPSLTGVLFFYLGKLSSDYNVYNYVKSVKFLYSILCVFFIAIFILLINLLLLIH